MLYVGCITDLNARLIHNEELKKSATSKPSTATAAAAKKNDAVQPDDTKAVEVGPLTIPMHSFRPNIVVNTGGRGVDTAWSEDWYDVIQFGALPSTDDALAPQPLVARVIKPCDRCIVPNLDPDTGALRAGGVNEPRRTLNKYRSVDEATFFGALISPLAEDDPVPAPASATAKGSGGGGDSKAAAAAAPAQPQPLIEPFKNPLTEPIVVTARGHSVNRSMATATIRVGDVVSVLSIRDQFLPHTTTLPSLIGIQPPN